MAAAQTLTCCGHTAADARLVQGRSSGQRHAQVVHLVRCIGWRALSFSFACSCVPTSLAAETVLFVGLLWQSTVQWESQKTCRCRVAQSLEARPSRKAAICTLHMSYAV